MAKPNTNALLMVPNTPEGQEFMRQFKQYLNKDKYTFKARGRKPNYIKMVQADFYGTFAQRRGDYILPVCDEHHIYLRTKKRIPLYGRNATMGVDVSTTEAYARECNKNHAMLNAFERIYKVLFKKTIIQAIQVIQEVAGSYTDDYIKAEVNPHNLAI